MGKATYKEIFEALKKDILGGKYDVAHALPSVGALARKYGVARATVHHSLDELFHHGLILRKQGSGTFVSRQGASRKIGLILPGLAYSEFFEPIASALIRHARERDYTLLFSDVFSKDASKRSDEAIASAKDLVAHHAAGVLFQPLEGFAGCEKRNMLVLSILKENGMPVVLLDSDYTPKLRRSGYDVVSLNNLEAGMQLARHLVEMGAKNIHFLRWPDFSPSVEEREFGMSVVISQTRGRGFAKTGDRALVTDPGDVEAVRKYCRRHRPDAFICATDMAAAGLKQSLEQCGLRVPDDVLLAGFDDVRVARFMTPPLTTIRQPGDSIARIAFDRLIARLANPMMGGAEINVYGSLIVRASTQRGPKACGRRKPRP